MTVCNGVGTFRPDDVTGVVEATSSAEDWTALVDPVAVESTDRFVSCRQFDVAVQALTCVAADRARDSVTASGGKTFSETV